ncbi:uncharacterized protein TNIN_189671 [Trichonephila inaurata madagascariensis]|uniref:Uncharacterized protein n=1 Tax=Trichonephila inaurata madagascariensis TaxID=2747483 RepID=A0A8X6MF29_9ARAC|nr:uncharacterized protein TNIN_189671 [Trichonephila inaurata madagascariensis]
MANTSPEFKFARDVIRYVLTEYWPGTHWNPSGIFVEYDLDSPCTPDVQYVMRDFLDKKNVDLHESYDGYFPNKNISPQQHYEFCQKITSSLIMMNESAEVIYTFLKLCASLSLFTALSVVYGVNAAPVITHRLLLRYFTSLQNRKFITDTFWMELQTFCEHY